MRHRRQRHRRNRFPAVALLALVAAPTLALAQTTEPATDEQSRARAAFVAEQRALIANMRAQFDASPARRIDDVLSFAIEDGNLTITTVGTPLGDQASLPLAEGNGAITVNRMRSHTAPEVSFLNLIYTRLDDADPQRPRATFVQVMTDPRGMNVTLNEQTPTATTNADLTDHPRPMGDDDPPMAKLRFQRTTEADDANAAASVAPVDLPMNVELTADTFADLLDAHHDAIVSATVEGFTSLRAMHVLAGLSERQARQLLLGDARVDPDVSRGVGDVLDALRRDGPDAVDASVAKLAALGPRAATLLGQQDRKGWSADLKLNVDTVLAQVSALPAQKSQAVLASPGRLIDLLYWPDLTIRRAAAQRLEPTLGKALLARFNPAKDPYAQATLIESLRAALPVDAKAK